MEDVGEEMMTREMYYEQNEKTYGKVLKENLQNKLN